MRVKLALACVVLGLAAVAPAAHADPQISYACFAGATPIDCGGWHTTPVTLTWTYSDPGHPYTTTGCTPQTFTHDAALITVSCKLEDDATSLTKTVKLHIDMTPPRVTGATPARPADHAGWWNHPVAIAFAGTDATSGIASCDTVAYSGPDGAAAVATGACRDRAGNAATGAFTFAYDATPPKVMSVSEVPGDHRVMLGWHVSPDTTRVDVVRSSGSGARQASIYNGTGARFTDMRAANGRTYRYTVTAFDAAGNADSASVRATPSALLPRAGSRVHRAPFLRWHRIAHARYYNVQVFRGQRKVLSAWPTRSGLRLHRAWSFNGHRYRLRRGSYRWYVWPGFGPRSQHRYGALIGRSSFRVVR